MGYHAQGLIVVEGFNDVIQLDSLGVLVVGACSNEITEAQASKIASDMSESTNRDDFWKLLVTISLRKASTYRTRESAQKRGGGSLRGDSVFRQPGKGLDMVADGGRSPEEVVETADIADRIVEFLTRAGAGTRAAVASDGLRSRPSNRHGWQILADINRRVMPGVKHVSF